MGVCAAAVLDEVAEDALVVVADNEDLADLWDSCDGGEAVLNDGVSRDLEERLLRVSPLSNVCRSPSMYVPWGGRGRGVGIVFLVKDRQPEHM